MNCCSKLKICWHSHRNRLLQFLVQDTLPYTCLSALSWSLCLFFNFLHMMVWWTCIGQFLRLNEGMNKHERFSSHVSHKQWDKLPTSHVQLVIYMLLNIHLAGLLCHSTNYVSGFINVILAIVRTRRGLLFLVVVVLTLCSHMSCTRKFVPIEHYFPG